MRPHRRHEIPPSHGDEAELFAEHHAELERRVASAVSAPRAVIEDACATAWVQLLRYQPERGEHLLGWLFVVARREAIRQVTSRRRADALEPLAEETFALISDEREHLAPRLEARRALEALAALPTRQRDYMTRFVAGASYEEIMEKFEVTYTNVNKHLTRARANLCES